MQAKNFPLNPSQVTGRQLMPSVGVKPKQKDVDPSAEKERPSCNVSSKSQIPELSTESMCTNFENGITNEAILYSVTGSNCLMRLQSCEKQ